MEDVSELLLKAAQEVEEACGMIENEKLVLKLREVVNLLCFTSAIYFAEREGIDVRKNVIIPFKRK